MRRVLVTVLAVVGLFALFAAPSFAATGNGHFIKNATSCAPSGANLLCSFKEAGLAAGSVETITLNATATTTYECVNGGGKNPSASNKRTMVTRVSTSGQFTADKNGNVTGNLTLSPPTAAQLGFACPPGQTVTFVSVSYSNISITDATSGATIALTGAYGYRNPAAP